MVFGVDALTSWLIGLVADAGRKRVTIWVLGSDQERALRQAAALAVQRTAEDLQPNSGDPVAHLAMVVNEVFRDPVPTVTSASRQVTLLEALQAGIATQLAPLDDRDLTGVGVSSAELLGLSAATLAEKLTTNLLREIVMRGAGGGPLAPLANQLDHDVTHLKMQQVEGMLHRLPNRILEALAGLEDGLILPAPSASDEPGQVEQGSRRHLPHTPWVT